MNTYFVTSSYTTADGEVRALSHFGVEAESEEAALALLGVAPGDVLTCETADERSMDEMLFDEQKAEDMGYFSDDLWQPMSLRREALLQPDYNLRVQMLGICSGEQARICKEGAWMAGEDGDYEGRRNSLELASAYQHACDVFALEERITQEAA